MKLKTWGIHHWKEEVHPGLMLGCYFIERPFGNLFIFPPTEAAFLLEKDLPFLESKGGVSLQVQPQLEKRTLLQKAIYNRFGAPLLVEEDTELLRKLTKDDYEFRYALNGIDHFDPHTEFKKIQGINCIKIYQRERNFVFLPKDFVFDRSQVRLGSRALTQENLSEDLEKECILLFQAYRGQNSLHYCP